MELVLTEEMRVLEERSREEYGLSSRVLMENAGFAAFQLVREVLNSCLLGKKVLVCVGKGNNGGDALVLARYLANSGARVVVAMTAFRESLHGPALEALGAVAQMAEDTDSQTDNGWVWLHECTDLEWKRHLDSQAPFDLVIDGLLGTGITGTIRGVINEMVKYINSLSCPCVALDIPTGINGDNGQIGTEQVSEDLADYAVRADYTITFGRPKVGLFCYPAPDYVGELRVADLGIPATLVRKTNLQHFLVEPKMVQRLLPSRPNASHKGSFGHVLTIGGSLGLSGAPSLASLAALRSGAGKSTLAGPACLNGIFEAKLTEVMTIPLTETAEGTIASKAQFSLVPRWKEFNVFLIGPGLSVHLETADFLVDFLSGIRGKIVLDADALNIMATQPDTFSTILQDFSDHPVLTPHPGEMARLLGISIREVQEYRVQAAREAAARWSSIVVLKGANTLIATPEGNLFVNTTGHSGMATAGTGDVLAGMVAGFLAQGASPLGAAVCGAYFHGLAGEKARKAGFNAGLIAGDLLNFLPPVLEEFAHLGVRK